LRGLFVTATDTGVGKSVLSASLLASMHATGVPVRAHKPVVTGLEDPREIAARGAWPADHELLAGVSGMRTHEVSPLRFGPAVSPHLAGELAGAPVDADELRAHARALAAAEPAQGALIVEGVGGLLAPLARDYLVRDHALALGLPVVIAARPGLGTINHTLLTLEAARSVALRVAAVVLTPWPSDPTRMELSNRETIARLGAVEVASLPRVAGPEPGALARAGDGLPWRRWLEPA
jgi:dethiobiotin synthetase